MNKNHITNMLIKNKSNEFHAITPNNKIRSGSQKKRNFDNNKVVEGNGKRRTVVASNDCAFLEAFKETIVLPEHYAIDIDLQEELKEENKNIAEGERKCDNNGNVLFDRGKSFEEGKNIYNKNYQEWLSNVSK